MKTPTTTALITHVRDWFIRSRANPAADPELIRRFAEDRDDLAFASLVDQHGPMVLGVARRIVGDHHTAEDVFQATFLALARHAGRLRRRGSVPAWLHQTAANLAVTALRTRKRRERAEVEAGSRESQTPFDDLSSRERLAILDEELRRLPETYRLPLILCCLEGRSQDEAAHLLGWAPGSVKGRLERGRQRLKDRLTRRGLTFGLAGVPLPAVSSTLACQPREAVLHAVRTGQSASAAAAALADGVTKPLWAACWKPLLVLAAFGLVGLGVGMASRWMAPANPRVPDKAPPVAVAEHKPADPPADPFAGPLVQEPVARLGAFPLRIGNSAFALTPDGRTIVTVSPEGIARRFDANTGKLLERRQLGDRGDVFSRGWAHAWISADGKTVVFDDRRSGAITERLRLNVYDVASGKMIFRPTPGKGQYIVGYALSPDGKQLAVQVWTPGSDHSYSLRVYDLPGGLVKHLGPIEINVYDIRFTNDGKRVLVDQMISKTNAYTFTCFDVQAGKELWQVPRDWGTWAVSPDSKTLLSVQCGRQDGFQVIDMGHDPTKPTVRFLPCDAVHPNQEFVIAPDNHTVVLNQHDAIVVWDIHTGKEVRRFEPNEHGGGYGSGLGIFPPIAGQ